MRELKEIMADLEAIEDELRVDYDLTGWANRLHRMCAEMQRKIELQERIFKLSAGDRDFNTLIKNLGRDRNGKGSVVFEDFVAEVVLPSGGDLYLSVREENAVARSFYECHGMKVAGKVDWSGGTLPGLVYRLNPVR